MRIRTHWQERILRSPDGPGGGGGGGQGGQDGGSGQGGQGGQGGAQGGAAGGAALWDFSDLPEGLRGASNEETFKKVKGEYQGLRTKVSNFAPPKDAKDYKFEPADKIKSYFKNADDPFMVLARESAHKVGIPDSHFAPFINGVFAAAAEKGLLPPVYNPQAEIDAIGDLVAKGKSPDECKTAIEAAITEAEAFAPALADSLKLSPAAKKMLQAMTGEAGGVELFRALKASGKEFGIQLEGNSNSQTGYSKADYDKDVADPRYQPFSPKYDAKWREGVDAKAKVLFGTNRPAAP